MGVYGFVEREVGRKQREWRKERERKGREKREERRGKIKWEVGNLVGLVHL
jgi:hypothetical protein